MKFVRFLILLLFISFSEKTIAQNRRADSLLVLIKNHSAFDNRKVDLQNEYASEISEQEHEKAIDIAETSYALANKLNYKNGIAKAALIIGIDYSLFQMKFDSASKYALEALKLGEETGDKRIQSRANNCLSMCYQHSNYDVTLNYRQKALQLATEAGDYTLMSSYMCSISLLYEMKKNYGQALEGFAKAIKYMEKSEDKTGLPGIYESIGGVYYRMNNFDSALFYNKLATESADKIGYIRASASFRRDLGLTYFTLKDTTNGFKYTKEALKIAKENKIQSIVMNCYSDLAIAYEKAKNYEYALKYSNLYYKMRDETDNSQSALNMERLQNKFHDEKEKVLEEKLVAKQERKKNIQFAGIGIGIISLLILTLLLSRSIIVTPRFVKIFGIIGLLITFEFLNLLLHPVLENITHHSPILMLFALASLAALLVPLHHNLEKWITSKLVEKNQKIRLVKAKKIIEEAEKTEENK